MKKEITAYERNPKKHPDAQLRQIAASLKEFGWRQPIVVDKKNVIIVGHGRYMAYHKYPEGIKEPWVVKADDLTPQQVRAYRLADNKTNESEWDMDLVMEELKDLDKDGYDITITGFDRDLLIESSEKDNKVPDNAPTRAKLGDVWLLGPHKVLCGDSTQAGALEALMGETKADMVFTDPPYNVDYTGKTKKALKIQNDKQGGTEFYDFLFAAFQNIAKYTKAGAAAYVCHADTEGVNFRLAFTAAGFELKQCLIWNKNHMVLGRQDYQWKHEPILYGWQKGKSHNWFGGRAQVTVWDVEKPVKSEQHPTMKPVELITRALLNSSKEEDIVLDPFLGSGSTLIACEKANRICYGVELDPKYMDVIIQRYEEYSGKEAEKI